MTSSAKQEHDRLVKALDKLDQLSDLWQHPVGKSAEESARARREGNKLFVAGGHDVLRHTEILKLYSRSVAYAPPASEELALAYGNRSALFTHLERYHDAIDDLNRALCFPLPDLLVIKYLCRKVECQAELGLQEAKKTCKKAKAVLQDATASDEVKKNYVIKLVNAVVKLEKREYTKAEAKVKHELPNANRFNKYRSAECAGSSSAIRISYSDSQGRHLTACQDIAPGEVVYVGDAYALVPMESHEHTNCSHCLKFAWAGLPCDGCVHAVYCSVECKAAAREGYHDVECRVISRVRKHCDDGNTGRLLCVRMLIMAIREAGGLEDLRRSVEDVDACRDPRKKGFSNDQSVFLNNHRSVYSLLSHAEKLDEDMLTFVSEDSAVLLHLLARFTQIFRRHFEYDKRALINNEDALFIGKLLSHYQHLVIINSTTVKDAYNESSVDWNWTAPKEENCSGLYLNAFVSLLNHSCFPNIARCETEGRGTILYSIRPILQGEELLESYGPTYAELPKPNRRKLLSSFFFECSCVACKYDWPVFKNTPIAGMSFTTNNFTAVEATTKAHQRSDKIHEAMSKGKWECDLDTLRDFAHAIILTLKCCKSPNWRVPCLMASIVAVFNRLYGYLINMPDKCP